MMRLVWLKPSEQREEHRKGSQEMIMQLGFGLCFTEIRSPSDWIKGMNYWFAFLNGDKIAFENESEE